MGRRTPKSVKKSCDRLFSLIVRSQGFCTRCGSTQNLQAAHIYSRKFNSVRFDENNALCLCASCHRWQHDCPSENIKWLETFVDLDKLKLKKNTVIDKKKLHDWIELEEALKKKLKEKDL